MEYAQRDQNPQSIKQVFMPFLWRVDIEQFVSFFLFIFNADCFFFTIDGNYGQKQNEHALGIISVTASRHRINRRLYTRTHLVVKYR